jgi:4-amino-4-deoxy-L-arabinose transferase-like glycosyltransferase
VRLSWVLAVALLLRLAAAAAHAVQGPVVQPDEANYLLVARALVEDHRFATHPGGPLEVIRGPAYPAFLVPFVLLFGPRAAGPALGQAVLGTLTVWIVVDALRRLLVYRGLAREDARRSALVAGWLCALSPIAIAWERLVMSEALATALLVAAAAAWWRSTDGGGPRHAIASGLCFGALALGKPAFLPLPFLLALAYAVRDPRARRARALGLVGATVLTVAPWALRNHQVLGRPSPSGLGAGLFLYAATLPRAADGVPVFEDPADRAGIERYLNHDSSVGERLALDSDFHQRALVRIRARPLAYAASCAARAARLWVSSHAESIRPTVVPRPVRVALALASGMVAALALSAWWIPRPGWRGAAAALAWVPAYTTLVHVPLASGSRYAVVAWPFVWALAALAVCARRPRAAGTTA